MAPSLRLPVAQFMLISKIRVHRIVGRTDYWQRRGTDEDRGQIDDNRGYGTPHRTNEGIEAEQR